MNGLDKLADAIDEIRNDLKALNDKPMAIDSLKDTYIGCIYCGEPKGNSLSCCGENHFEEMEEE